MVDLAAAWEKGGPNDPTVAFSGLREKLTEVKDELSPYAWRAYNAEFRERQKAEKKLQGLNNLPGSGAEPQDGIIQGTPLWQERLDKMLLVEHLKKKIMSAHSYMTDSSELMLKSHGWLVRSPALADKFIECITHVPASQHERVDLLQEALLMMKKQLDDLRNEFEDYIVQLGIQREKFLQRIVDHQKVQINRERCDYTVVLWSYQAQRETALRLDENRRNLQARLHLLEATFATQSEDLVESRRQWAEEKAALTADRDKYKKLYNRMVKAHEKAMEDLKNSQGSVEDQAKMIMALSTENTVLKDKVKDLEDDKKRMEKQLAELRDELAKIRAEMRTMRERTRDTEALLCEVRQEVDRYEALVPCLEQSLDEAATLEAHLRDDLLVSRAEKRASDARTNEAIAELELERRVAPLLEAERDDLLQKMRDTEAEQIRVINESRKRVRKVKEKAKRELEDFKTTELARVRADFKQKTDKLIRRNEILEREVAEGEACGPHLASLNPLAVDDSHLCANCRKVIVFEGVLKQ